MSRNFHVGQRLIVQGGPQDGALCTVRYVGEVHGVKGKEWLGIEYDDPSLGKHDGELEGRRYFECRSRTGKPATFIRNSRPFQKANSFLDALRNKYALNASSVDGLKRMRPESSIIVISGKEVEEVGFDRIREQQSKLHDLSRVILEDERITGTDSTSNGARQALHEAISRTCSNIIELDLGRNLLETWDDVADICCALKKLKTLKATGNRFRDVSLTRYPGRDPFRNVKELVLDECFLNWEEIAQITQADSFPSLVDLSLAGNALSIVPSALDNTKLTSLNLNDNYFTDLASLRPLTSLSNLARLSLQGNLISATGDSHKPCFPSSLQHVDLSRNSIASWSFVDALHTIFPGLTSMKISNNPLYEQPISTILSPTPSTLSAPPPPAMTIEEAFMLTLSRIATLQTLNYSTVKPADRQNAELFYLSVIRRELETLPSASVAAETAIIARHPRYGELCELYGAPVVARKENASGGAINPRSLEARLVQFRLYIPSSTAAADQQKQEHVVKIPKTVDVYRVKAIVAKLFALPALGFKLVHETEELDPVHEVEDDWDEDEDDEGDNAETKVKADKWVRREVELVDSVRDVGSFLDDDVKEVRIRVEPHRS